MAGAPDIEHLGTLMQEDLAIIMCERWAYGPPCAANFEAHHEVTSTAI
jgi:hypothetical protein